MRIEYAYNHNKLQSFCVQSVIILKSKQKKNTPCSEGQRYFIITTITPLHCNSYIIIVNIYQYTFFYHKESKGTFNIANKNTNSLLYLFNINLASEIDLHRKGSYSYNGENV